MGLTYDVSIHAPAWGATNANGSFLWFRKCFNPRTRVGCDPRLLSVSEPKRKFQSTHPRGVRRASYAVQLFLQQFQSTHPRGVRRGTTLTPSMNIFSFQSTHPRGVRRQLLDRLAQTFVLFQSTHPRGVRRPGRDALARDGNCFNPRTRVGCDFHRGHGLCRRHGVSIHAPAWGAT